MNGIWVLMDVRGVIVKHKMGMHSVWCGLGSFDFKDEIVACSLAANDASPHVRNNPIHKSTHLSLVLSNFSLFNLNVKPRG